MNSIDGIVWDIGEAFLKGIFLEMGSCPKPGLVDPLTSGSHDDMSFLTFMMSSAAIAPAFYICAQVGRDHKGQVVDLLPEIRKVGRVYEQKLLQSTKEVNTQRGTLFSIGILCGAAGYLSQTVDSFSIESVCEMAAEITQGLSARELEKCRKAYTEQTAGEQLFMKYGTKGIRGEVENGFPSVMNVGLPAFEKAMGFGLSLNHTLIHTLIALMTSVEDTTILWRKGVDGLQVVQEMAGRIEEQGSVFSKKGLEEIARLEEWFVENNISPGGSADLLAATTGLYFLEHKTFPGEIQ